MNVYEEAVFVLIGAESPDEVEQDRVGVVEVGVGDEHWGVWERPRTHDILIASTFL